MRQIFNNRKEKLGRCIVKHCDPIDLDQYLESYFQNKGIAMNQDQFEKISNIEF